MALHSDPARSSMNMEQQPIKPLGQKGYGTIPPLPGSRRGPGDKGVNEGQFRICCVKTPPDRKGDVIWVQEKLDGCLHSSQPVMTDQGEITISTIVEQQLPVQVLTYNET